MSVHQLDKIDWIKKQQIINNKNLIKMMNVILGTCLCTNGWNGKHCTLEGCPANCNGIDDHVDDHDDDHEDDHNDHDHSSELS